MHHFTYEPLDLVQPSFRLVRLMRETEGPVECDLFHAHVHDADNSIDYEALSYTWGCATEAYNVTVNGGCFALTENLYQALKHLRDKDEDRILWIDAICINQDDAKERGHQVRQMASIYECARQIIIWLGEPANGTDALFDSIRAFERQALNHACNNWSPSDSRWQFLWAAATLDQVDDDLGQHIMHHAFSVLLGREWFRRIWVLQEVAKARAAKVACGTKSVSARFFALLPPLLGIQTESHCQSVLDTMPGPCRKYSWWTQNRDLFTLLRKFSGSQASDSRDLVYALLGISSDASNAETLLPDNNKSEEEVVQRTLVYLLGMLEGSLVTRVLPKWTMQELQSSLDHIEEKLLPWAIAEGDEDLFDFVFKRNRAVSTAFFARTKDFYGRSVLPWAAIRGSARIAKLFRDTWPPTDLDHKDWLGQTPLSLAAENSHHEVAKKLL